MTRTRTGLLLAGLTLGGAACGRAPVHEPPGATLRLAPAPPPAFARALAPRPFALPQDHGPHADYQTEWWYYTGQLAAADTRRFGFQLTFFRRGLAPGEPAGAATLATHQVYFAHFALTDVAADRHVFFERFARGAGGLAGATGAPYTVWLEDWRVQALDADGARVRLAASDGGHALDLVLASRKPLVAHGDRGLSAKSGEPGNASYYVGYTRLAAEGRLTLGDPAGTAGAPLAVRGEAWFDHEWSTSALGAGARGWDWFSLQLSDGRELMCFQIRRDDGGRDPASSGTLVDPQGGTRRLGRDDVQIDVLDHWTSPQTGARYPARWRLRVPALALDVRVEPWIPGQEMRTSFLYWEGAVRLQGTSAGGPVTGQGYVELTGYAASMQGVF
jgi:predicted secreted hydrolase